MNSEVRVIILEGTSSSGKSTLARILQAKLDGVYLHCQLDAFWNMTPSSVPAGSLNFPNMKLAMAKSVRALTDTGHNVIVDVIYSGTQSHREFADALVGVRTYFVKLTCSLNELERREVARGDRRIGLAKSQFELAAAHIPYDLELDTSILSPPECADRIAQLLV